VSDLFGSVFRRDLIPTLGKRADDLRYSREDIGACLENVTPVRILNEYLKGSTHICLKFSEGHLRTGDYEGVKRDYGLVFSISDVVWEGPSIARIGKGDKVGIVVNGPDEQHWLERYGPIPERHAIDHRCLQTANVLVRVDGLGKDREGVFVRFLRSRVGLYGFNQIRVSRSHGAG